MNVDLCSRSLLISSRHRLSASSRAGEFQAISSRSLSALLHSSQPTMPAGDVMQISPFDVRPDVHGIDAMRDALKEVHTVKAIVDGWVEELER